jgi:hypothetical protein
MNKIKVKKYDNIKQENILIHLFFKFTIFYFYSLTYLTKEIEIINIIYEYIK